MCVNGSSLISIDQYQIYYHQSPVEWDWMVVDEVGPVLSVILLQSVNPSLSSTVPAGFADNVVSIVVTPCIIASNRVSTNSNRFTSPEPGYGLDGSETTNRCQWIHWLNQWIRYSITIVNWDQGKCQSHILFSSRSIRKRILFWKRQIRQSTLSRSASSKISQFINAKVRKGYGFHLF